MLNIFQVLYYHTWQMAATLDGLDLKSFFFNIAYSEILTADLFQASLSYWNWDSKRFTSLEAPFH